MTTSETPPVDGELDRRGTPHGRARRRPVGARRRRRPTGAPAAAAAEASARRARAGWSASVLLVGVGRRHARSRRGARRLTDQVDAAILRAFARLRTDWLTDVLAGDRPGGDRLDDVRRRARPARRDDRVPALAPPVHVPRQRDRPRGPRAAADRGVLAPAALRRDDHRPLARASRCRRRRVAVVSFTVVGVIYTLVVPGRPRTIAKVVGVVVVGVVVVRPPVPRRRPSLRRAHRASPSASPSRCSPSGSSPPTSCSRSPTARGKTAHLDVGGRRGEAIRRAVEDQLGVTVVDVKPVGLAGSGGSTPLRLRIAGDPDTYLFGKLYAMNHVRADRWYKLGRTILYGRLEDERPFQSVRRLVQYEDYALRLLRDAGVPTAAADRASSS